MLEKTHSYQNEVEKSYTEKKLSIHLLFTHCSQLVYLVQQKTNFDCYKEKDCIGRFCKDLREDAIKTSTAAVEPQHLKVEVAD